jgi:hypothetical protein
MNHRIEHLLADLQEERGRRNRAALDALSELAVALAALKRSKTDVALERVEVAFDLIDKLVDR